MIANSLYSKARTYYQRQTRPSLGALLASSESDNTDNTGSTAPMPMQIERWATLQHSRFATVVAAMQEAFAELKSFTLPQLQQDARREHLAELTGREIELSKEEQEQNHYLTVSLVSLGVTGTAALFHLPLAMISAPLLGYLYIPVIKNTYQAFQKKEQRWLRSFEFIVIGGELLAGLYVAYALDAVLYFFAERALVKAEEKSRQDLIHVFGQQPRSAWMLVDGVECNVAFDQVKTGDIVVVNAGESIPVDGCIVQGMASIDQHMLTGEAQPMEKGIGSQVLASTIVLSGKIHIQVERAGSETTAAQIEQILNQTAAFKDKIETRSIALTERFIPFTLAMGLVSLPFLGSNRALALLESNLGYDLRMSGPMSLLNLLQIAAQEGVLIKDGAALEQLHTIDTVVFDKTGTLTLEQPHISIIHTYNSFSEEAVLTWAAAAEYRQTHPIARAILQAARERDIALPTIDEAHYKVGYGIQVTLDERIIRVGSIRFLAMEQVDIPDAVHELQITCHERGYSLVLVAVDRALVGAIELHPTIRPEAREIVQQLKQRNLRLYIISGDHQQPTQHLAHSIGIDHYFAEVLPQDKAALVAQLQQEGRKVCFVGDGINDAIALKQADLSVSLRGATTVAIDAAQVVMMDGSLQHLLSFLDLGQEYEATMQKNLLLATVPGVICIGGVYFLRWGVLTTILLSNLIRASSMGNAMLPLLMHRLNRNKEEQATLPAARVLQQPAPAPEQEPEKDTP